jgi:hypothetical protein
MPTVPHALYVGDAHAPESARSSCGSSYDLPVRRATVAASVEKGRNTAEKSAIFRTKGRLERSAGSLRGLPSRCLQRSDQSGRWSPLPSKPSR